ncbi:MAG: DUF4062 domain-containing protein [Bacteroidetes bacterium]|nr:DUF4062 domain-containing protein [Bacteroidota bacterium]
MESEKYQIFVSSPFRGLEKQRKAVVQSVINWEHIPIALENFSPQVQKDFDVIKKAVQDCQIYILIIGHTYGSIVENKEITGGREISYTQFEFEEATKQGLVPIVFMKNYKEACDAIMEDSEIEDKGIEKRRLQDFHGLIKKEQGIFYRPWDEKTNLEEVCGRAIKTAICNKKIELPGWIRAGKDKSTRKAQMALNNVFVLDMIKNINSYKKLDERCSIDVREKETLAKLFREKFLNPIINYKLSLFFESDSSPAFVAKEIGSAKKFAKAVLENSEENALNLYTNNILAFLELWMNSHLPVSMRPNSSPKEQYGASYGILDDLIDEERTPDYDREDIDEHAKNAIEKLANSPDALPDNENILLICSTSGVQISDSHELKPKPKDDELQKLIDLCYGFHAGSYKNVIFKRYLYSTKSPIIITMTSSEIDIEIIPGRCHFIFDRRYVWEEFYKNHPLAFCVGCDTTKRKEVIELFEELGFKVQSKIYDDYTGVLATNSMFEEKIKL